MLTRDKKHTSRFYFKRCPRVTPDSWQLAILREIQVSAIARVGQPAIHSYELWYQPSSGCQLIAVISQSVPILRKSPDSWLSSFPTLCYQERITRHLSWLTSKHKSNTFLGTALKGHKGDFPLNMTFFTLMSFDFWVFSLCPQFYETIGGAYSLLMVTRLRLSLG